MLMTIGIIPVVIFVSLPFTLADHLLQVLPRGVVHIQKIRRHAQPAIAAAFLAVVNPAPIFGVTQETVQEPQPGRDERHG